MHTRNRTDARTDTCAYSRANEQGLASTIEETMKTIPLMQKVVSPFLYSIVSGVLISHGHNLFLKTSPRRLLQGHHINIFETAAELVEPFSVFGIKKSDLLPSEELPNNAFGILNGKNDTATGPYEIYTGVTDQSKYAYMVSWKGQRAMDKWPTAECNAIFGTDGAQFPPFRSKRDKLPIFAPDLCRTLYAIYERETDFKGIPVWRMKLDPKVFESPAMNPDNECFCAHAKKRPDRCAIRGIIDLSGCLNGAPLVLSAPHFLGTSPDLSALVDGLTPEREKHEFSLLFEPRLGTPVFAYGRLQLSIRVERTSFLRGFDQVRNAFIPFVWIEESGGVDDFLATVLKVILVYVIDGSQSAATFLMMAGWLAFLAALVYGLFCTGRDMESEERLYSRSTSSKGQSEIKLAHIDSERDEEDGEESGSSDSESSSSNASHSRTRTADSETSHLRSSRLEMRASAPTLEPKRTSSPEDRLPLTRSLSPKAPVSPTIRHSYVPVYRETTTTTSTSSSAGGQTVQTRTTQQYQQSRSFSSRNVTTTTSASPRGPLTPPATTTTAPLTLSSLLTGSNGEARGSGVAPTTTTTTTGRSGRDSSLSAKSLPRIRDLEEIRVTRPGAKSPPLVDTRLSQL